MEVDKYVFDKLLERGFRNAHTLDNHEVMDEVKIGYTLIHNDLRQILVYFSVNVFTVIYTFKGSVCSCCCRCLQYGSICKAASEPCT